MIYGLVRLREPMLAPVAATSFIATSAMAQTAPSTAPAVTNATGPQLVNTIPAITTSGAAPQDPPFCNGNPSGIVAGSAGFNGFVSNPIGRIVSVELRADF